jgi:UDP-glucose:(heptosyl)LPS alpha-1,3-glucosyltransferase
VKIGIAYLEYSRRKGIERISAELADRVAQSGHDVHFHCIRWMDVRSSKVQFHRVRAIAHPNSATLLSFAVLGKASIERGNYNVTHSYGNVVGCDVITAQSCHLAGMETRKRLEEKTMRTEMNFGVADRIRLMIERKNYAGRRYRKVIAVSEGVKRELIQYYGVPVSDIVVIPNGVDLDEFNPANRLRFRDQLREQLQISSDAPVLIFVGNEFDRKGLSFIIEALPLVKIPDLKLLVLGGDDRSPYLKLARKLGVDRQILFLGNVRDISRYYALSDVFVLPTFYEAFSVATLEAAASGLPLITTKVNGTEELVREGYNGCFVRRDSKEVAEKIHVFLQDRDKLAELGANARKSVERYSWDIITEKTLQVYEEIRHSKSS